MKTKLTHRSSPCSFPCRIAFTIMLLLTALTGLAAPVGTAITYQGRLNFSGSPATNGFYDFRFTLHDSATVIPSVGSAVTVSAVPVTNGLFTVPLDFGATAFTSGEARWLQLQVNTNGITPLVTLNPRQRITPAPQAIYAGSAATASTVAAGAVTSSGLASGSVNGTAIADGSITSADLNTSLLNNTFWKLTGNDVAPGQFIGSSNNQPVEFKVFNQRALRLEPRGVGLSPNVLGGYSENTAGNFRGAAIAGGGTSGAINSADGNYSFIGAGIGGHTANSAVVGAGAYNSALGPFSLVGSGIANTNRGESSAIVAGTNNTITALADNAFIGGGHNNTANNTHATIGGGENNRVSSWSVVGGGRANQSDGSYATVAGGRENTSSGTYATVPGGFLNSAASTYSFAAGHRAKANHQGSFVWADSQNVDFASTASNQFSVRASGGLQLAPNTSAYFGTTPRQMLNLWDTRYGIGIQSYNLYFRTDDADGAGSFAWYRGGVHSDAAGNAGGGQRLMSLSAAGLDVNGTGPGVQGTTSNAGAPGVIGQNNAGGIGIAGRTTGGGIAVYGDNLDPAGYAGLFSGRVHIAGNVGIGTTSPGAKLHVAVPGSSSPIGAMQLEVGTFGSVANSLASTFLTVRDVGSGQMAFMIRGDGNIGIGTADPQARLDVAGTTRTCVLEITGGCDLAEPFPMSGKDLPKGAVVVIDEANPGHLRISESAYDTRVAGIISGANGVNPGISLHQEGVMEGGQNVALSGRVYVQADAANGPIKPGDLLTTSATPGHAMKVAEHGKAQGAILGKAMTALAEGKGLVLVLVSLQ